MFRAQDSGVECAKLSQALASIRICQMGGGKGACIIAERAHVAKDSLPPCPLLSAPRSANDHGRSGP